MIRLPWANTTEARTAAPSCVIAVFDFLSHDHVHLPFNEAYLRLLRAGYPSDRIVFRATPGHVERLAPRLADLANITFEPCEPFTPPLGLSHHNPLAGRWAARQCRNLIARETGGRPVRMTALLGFNASLLAVLGHGWPRVCAGPLHMILHSHLGEAVGWRSRNPFIRAGDLISQLERPLPLSVLIVALELGMNEAIGELSPALSRSIITLEHPILPSEWAESSSVIEAGKVKIGFVGHARRDKGFGTFVELATGCRRDDIEFHAIGHASPETDQLDTSALVRKPSREALPREDYLDALRGIDLVCLPLQSRAYNLTGSGTVSDAIAALKPLALFRNRTMEAIFARYGPIGWLVEDKDDLFALVRELDPVKFARERSSRIDNLRMVREARRPESLAKSYAALIGPSDRPRLAGRPGTRSMQSH